MTRRARANDSLDQLHADMKAAHMAPTWRYIHDFVSAEPRVTYRPYLWRWDDVYPLVMRSSDLISPDAGGERRSMEHDHPDLPGSFSASHTLATAFQYVQPGETAPAHRHAAGAIRFAVRSQGGDVFTRVEGEKLYMEQFDLVLTPSWTWHEHGNNTDHGIIWLDALDFPLVNLMQSSGFEPGVPSEPPERGDGFSVDRLGPVRPVGWGHVPEPTPAKRYPWAEVRPRLEAMRSEAGSPVDGIILEYVGSRGSGPTLPTMSCRVQLLRAGERTRAHRAVASTIYFVMEGGGETVIDGVRFAWGPGDVFVVPNWCWHEHAAGDADGLLFSVTDEPVMRTLGLYREEAFPDSGHQAVEGAFQLDI